MKYAYDSHGTGPTRWLLAVLVGMVIAAWSPAASALPCVEDKFGSNVNCTANDIRITEVSDIVVTDDGCTSAEDDVTFNATLTVVTTASARYDVGLFVGTDGVQAENGECEVFALPAVPDPPFENIDGDVCGDSSSAASLEVPVTGITVACEDANDDNNLDVASCTTWQQNTDGNCTGAADVEPGTASKCNCPLTPTDIPIFVPDPVCVTNAECEALATGCNVGVCDVANPDASEFGCVFTPDDSLCDDGLFCNGEETCDAGVCADGTAPDCDDSVSCTNDSCDEDNDECVNAPDNSLCDDGQFCNGVETCDATNGCTAGTAPDCTDEVACTHDSCNEATDACVNAPNNALCNDGQFCNGVETCDATNGCTAGTAPDCTDEVACTDDSCNEATDACVNAPNNALCNDGQFCNGVETCDATNGCTAGTAPDCTDEVVCTDDSCNEATDACVNAPNNALCNDGQFCNGVETCDATNGCTAGTAPDCTDEVACTDDSCNEATDACVNAPNNSLCDDGLFCNGDELCDETAGCTGGLPPLCDDNIACTVEECDEANNDCLFTGNDGICDDGNECTTDVCDPVDGCENEFICEGDICRSPGFWSTHGGLEKSGANVTQEVIDAAGGLDVCGQLITTTVDGSGVVDGLGLSSALEALCMKTQKEKIRQLYRQLVAAALNCVISATGDCDTIVGNHTEISFDECNTLCAGGDVGEDGPTLGECVSQLDCFNNGGEVVGGECSFGTCEVTGEPCGGDSGACPLFNDTAQDCVSFPGNCHSAELCQPAIDVCPPGGPASSPRACHEARGNECTIDSCN